jgi:hypothetical protein
MPLIIIIIPCGWVGQENSMGTIFARSMKEIPIVFTWANLSRQPI